MINVLIIEDNDLDYLVLKSQIQSFETPACNLTRASHANEATELIAKNNFDLVITDLSLPDVNGVEIIERLKGLTKKFPILVISGNEDDLVLDKVIHYGVFDFLLKGHNDMSLVRRSIISTLTRFALVTEKDNIEQQLLQSQRLDSLGKLTGGIAHEFNNKLSIISANVNLIENSNHDVQATQKILQAISRAVNHASSLTRQLLAFGRQQELIKKSCDLNVVLEDCFGMIVPLLPPHISAHFIKSELDVFARIDTGQINQVLTNLILNSRSAIGNEDGEIKLTVGSQKTDQFNSTVQSKIKSESLIVISVEDSGIGMSEEIKKRAFEPFFTTCTEGQGSGLGLSVVDGIINQHGGVINIKDRLPKGTTIEILLPTTNERAVSTQRQVLVSEQSSKCTILYAEDEADLREAIVEFLSGSGFDVISACDGQEALSKFLEQEDRIDVLLTDFRMPNLNGGQLIKEIRKRKKQIGCIVMTGYSAKELTSGDNTHLENIEIVFKPCDFNGLVTSIHKVSKLNFTLKSVG